MRRDWHLIRKMLLKVEDLNKGVLRPDAAFEGYTPDQVSYHAYLIADSELASAVQTLSEEHPWHDCVLLELTDDGRAFAALAREQGVWDAVWAKIRSKGLETVSQDILLELLLKEINGRLTLASV